VKQPTNISVSNPHKSLFYKKKKEKKVEGNRDRRMKEKNQLNHLNNLFTLDYIMRFNFRNEKEKENKNIRANPACNHIQSQPSL
jgi:hypothetical protein